MQLGSYRWRGVEKFRRRQQRTRWCRTTYCNFKVKRLINYALLPQKPKPNRWCIPPSSRTVRQYHKQKKNRKRKLHLGKKTTLNHRGGAVTQDVGLLPWSWVRLSWAYRMHVVCVHLQGLVLPRHGWDTLSSDCNKEAIQLPAFFIDLANGCQETEVPTILEQFNDPSHGWSVHGEGSGAEKSDIQDVEHFYIILWRWRKPRVE